MTELIRAITEKNYDTANALVEERVNTIMAKTLFEMKKAYAAKVGLSEASWRVQSEPSTPVSNTETQNNMDTADYHHKQMMDAAASGDEATAMYHRAKWNEHRNNGSIARTNSNLDRLQSIMGLSEQYNTLPSVEKAKRGLTEDEIDEEVELDEARVKIIKARIRGGKIQRRKKVSNVAGYTLRGGKLTKMSPTERRKRKLGAKRAKIKRRGKMSRILQKRKRSLMKRKALGI